MSETHTFSAVLDASALLAWLQNEPGHDLVDPYLEHGVISSVNWSEVIQKVLERHPRKAVELRVELEALGLTVRPFGSRDAEIAAALHRFLAPAGLSFADRACLATAIGLDIPAMTADRAWKGIRLPISVLLIR
jgi:ribonuclease VapC